MNFKQEWKFTASRPWFHVALFLIGNVFTNIDILKVDIIWKNKDIFYRFEYTRLKWWFMEKKLIWLLIIST